MSSKKIFLSYRRDDAPGYVARLEDDLEHAFGADRVFRDVEDISGGAEWRLALEENLARSGVLVLVIGPRWAEIWRTRPADEVNYVAFELERARELGIPVMPVTLNQASIPRDLDLGSVSWLRDRQFYDISDMQGRWPNDVLGLIQNLAALPGIGRPIVQGSRRTRVEEGGGVRRGSGLWMGVAAVVAVLVGAWLWLSGTPDPSSAAPTMDWTAPAPTPPISTPADAAMAPAGASTATVLPRAPQAVDYPDLSGTWLSQSDGTAYFVEQRGDGIFAISSPGYADGEAVFIPNMPRKFRVEMYGVGYGEFALSNTDDSAIGWLLNQQTNRKEYDTLQRVR